MANLVSAGVSVTVTDESFFIPAAAATVPLIFIATADEKKQPDGVTDAAGTFEHDVIRTVTSLKQSTQLYGVPKFLTDTSGQAQHGDVRNEYGVFALNQFLGIGNLAYVVRANVNLNDNLADIREMWDISMQESAYVLENIANSYLNEYNHSNGYVSSDPLFKVSITRSELISLVATATKQVWDKFSFNTLQADFMSNHTVVPLRVYSNGYNNPPVGTGFTGLTGLAIDWETNHLGSVVPTGWTPTEAGNTLLGASDAFKFTSEFMNKTDLVQMMPLVALLSLQLCKQLSIATLTFVQKRTSIT